MTNWAELITTESVTILVDESPPETGVILEGICIITIDRGSYMSAHVLLNLLNELRKRDKMRGLPSI